MRFPDVSKEPIKVANMLPANLEAQPAVIMHLCLRCIRNWGEGKDLTTPCERETPLKKCARCAKGKHDCLGLAPEFNRALNVLSLFFKEYQQHQAATPFKERFTSYAKSFSEAYKAWESQQRRDFKDAGGQETYLRLRADSYERNMARHAKRQGTIGKMLPKNCIVNSSLETYAWNTYIGKKFENQRWYWYGVTAQ